MSEETKTMTESELAKERLRGLLNLKTGAPIPETIPMYPHADRIAERFSYDGRVAKSVDEPLNVYAKDVEYMLSEKFSLESPKAIELPMDTNELISHAERLGALIDDRASAIELPMENELISHAERLGVLIDDRASAEKDGGDR